MGGREGAMVFLGLGCPAPVTGKLGEMFSDGGCDLLRIGTHPPSLVQAKFQGTGARLWCS
jgi:hypothetical protein